MTERVNDVNAAKIAGITRTSLHRWVRQGKITRYPDGYDQAEILKAADARSLDALLIRAGKCSKDRAAIHESVRQYRRVA